MTEVILTIVALLIILCIFIYLKVRNIYKSYKGFSNTAMKKALSGELPGEDIKYIRDAVALDKESKENMMKPKSSALIPLP